jgi:hypothetical protein
MPSKPKNGTRSTEKRVIPQTPLRFVVGSGVFVGRKGIGVQLQVRYNNMDGLGEVHLCCCLCSMPPCTSYGTKMT